MLQLEPNTTKITLIASPINAQVEMQGNKLLKIMKKRGTLNTENLPNDCKTLLQTPTTISANIRNIDAGNYYHFELAAGIKDMQCPI